MTRTVSRTGRQLLVGVVAAVTMAGCNGDAPLAPDRQAAARPQFTLGVCGELAPPAGSELVFHAYATGAQIYRWNGTSWTFVAPDATLYADAGGAGVVGTHYAGPTWESVSGSKVVGTVQKRCTPDASAIPWLLLGAASATGPGVFGTVTHIQRLNTTGGNAPAAAGALVGEEVRVAYTADYFFYTTE